MDAHALEQAVRHRLQVDGWSGIRVSQSASALVAVAERRGLNLVLRCLRPVKLVAVGEDTHGDPCTIVAEVGDVATPHDRWAIWHFERLPWTDADGKLWTMHGCPVVVGQGKYRVTVATYGWPDVLSGEEGATLSLQSLEDVMGHVDVFTSETESETASSRFDPVWSLSRWPAKVPWGAQRVVTIGGGATAGVGIAAAAATAATGAVPIAVMIAGAVVMPGLIAALVGHSLMRDRRVSSLVAGELLDMVEQSSVFDSHLGPFVAASITLPVLSAAHAVHRLVAVNTLMEATSSKHSVRLRVSHWALEGESKAVESLLLPPAWTCVELTAAESVLHRVDVPGALGGEGTAAWLADDVPSATRTVRAITVNLAEALRGHAAGAYR